MSYQAPLRDMQFVLEEVVGLERIASLPGYEEATPDLAAAVLEEANKLASEVLAPLNSTGDTQPSRWTEDGVLTPPGWKEAYRQFAEGGWISLGADPDHGGQGLPMLLSSAVQEMWHSSNMSFGLCPLLTQGAIDALHLHGSEQLKTSYLDKMISGEWTGTMNLTEPQAGTDLAAVRTRAEREGDHYRISGQKIFITYGDHDLTDNIVHMVLARTPDAPPGVKGISLFVVPKFLINDDGSLGERNDVRCVSIEHKLGIHGSPTAVMSFGDNGGSVGYLVGEENRGLMYMFVMMNLARHAVGVEGYAIAERAYQQAVGYARERVQGPTLCRGESRGIINHPDIRRILMTMRSVIAAARALAYEHAATFDRATKAGDADEAKKHMQRAELLTPLVKGWSSEMGVELCSLGLQVHGGMGFIEETGAAQHYRDARITTIYEGTTAIQANDLIGRKCARDGGEGVAELLADLREVAGELGDDAAGMRRALESGIAAAESATEWLLAQDDPCLPAAAAVNYLMLMGTVAGGWMMARRAVAAQAKLASGEGDASFYEAQLTTARFYMGQVMPRALAWHDAMLEGSADTVALEDVQF